MTAPENSKFLLDVRNLRKYFPVRSGFFAKVAAHVKAVDDVSFAIRPGEALGLVGESGCGKTTIGRCILRLIEPDEGKLLFLDEDLMKLSRSQMRIRRRDLQIIFQDPYASLNPRMTVGKIIGEGLIIHRMGRSSELTRRVRELLEIVGLNPAYASRYPHEFSGGQRQRIGIARALALNPRLIVCDEPVSALDVSIQAQVINLLQDLQDRMNLTYLFIAHDLSVVRHFCHRIAVMYLGRIVELATSEDLHSHTLHPYTNALLSSIPVPDPTHQKQRIILEGDVPTPIHKPSGCSFHTRCPVGKDKSICREVEPSLAEEAPGHFSACHFSGQI
ncbi:ATP-binding cassette domain-containing protein [bacterium]|nr:ATP-binding cassette domain-containing protein [candidate division CSSED10-310 bacterium]